MTTLTVEPVEMMTRAEAERATEHIRSALDRVSVAWGQLGERIADAYQRRADLALGYDSWDAYADAELRPSHELSADIRRKLVGLLSAQGMSTRAIAPTVGASHMAVHRDRVAGVTERYTSPAAEVGNDSPPAPTGSTIATTEGVVIAQTERIDPATGEVVLGSVAALAEVVANSHPIHRGAVDNLGENLNTGPQGIELGTRSEPNERVTVIEVLEDRVVGLEAGLDPREDVLNTHAPTVAKITGLDGKTYTRRETTTAPTDSEEEPVTTKVTNWGRWDEARELAAQGMTITEVHERLGYPSSPGAFHGTARAHGITFPYARIVARNRKRSADVLDRATGVIVTAVENLHDIVNPAHLDAAARDEALARLLAARHNLNLFIRTLKDS